VLAGLDVSIEETAICVVDAKGEVLFHRHGGNRPADIAAALGPFAAMLRRVGHEPGALSPWRTSCAPVGSARPTSRAKTRIGCGCC
jgi:hypothetical protein